MHRHRASGTGKTVMAIYRRASFIDRDGKPLLLMYGRLLSSYARAAVESLRSTGRYGRTTAGSPSSGGDVTGSPRQSRDPGHSIGALASRRSSAHPQRCPNAVTFLIDEGQDMPRDFYLVLKLISESLMVFADENQRITEPAVHHR